MKKKVRHTYMFQRNGKHLVLAIAGILLLGGLVFSQGMGGRMGGSSVMGIDGMNGAAMGMAGSAITVASDGTLYTISRVASTTTTTTTTLQTRLSALDGNSGTVLWSLILDERWLSRPVEASDGRLFLVSFSQGGMGSGSMWGRSSTLEVENARFYVVDPTTRKIVKTVELDGEVASVPLIGGPAANYTVYVVVFDMDHDLTTQGQAASRDATLLAFDRNGVLKFSATLDR